MSNINFCGIDFGTSNSTIGSVKDGKALLLPVEKDKVTIPTALFYNFEDDDVYYGREAVEEYVDGAWGRLMRSLKSVLGTDLMHDTTQVKTKHLAFTDIIATFLTQMKAQAEKNMGCELESVLMGRPVHFIDENKSRDKEAQDTLEKIARSVGFKNVEFQFEPLAAARDYEQHATKQELAMIIDMGGGTSDFSIVRIDPNANGDREQDILANEGVHIGGTDVDKAFSLHSIMPHLGYGSLMKETGTALPKHTYHDLATWQKIHFLYEKEVIIGLKSLIRRVEQPHLIERLIKVAEEKLGHSLAIASETAKINLSDTDTVDVNLSMIEAGLHSPVTQEELNASIQNDVEKVIRTINHTLNVAGVTASDISTIFLTGGTTAIPHVRHSVLALFPQAKVMDGDRFGSVGIGLTLQAEEMFS